MAAGTARDLKSKKGATTTRNLLSLPIFCSFQIRSQELHSLSLKRRKVLHKKETKLPGKLLSTVGLQPRKLTNAQLKPEGKRALRFLAVKDGPR